MKKVSIAFVFVFSALAFLNPLRSYDLFNRIRLKLAGVAAKNSDHFEYFEKRLGEAPTCGLLIHGLGDHAFTWNPQMLRSAEDWPSVGKLVAVNLPGSGRSPRLGSEGEYQISELAKLLQNEILAQCSSWFVLGNSFGGWIALRLAQMEQRRIVLTAVDSPAGVSGDFSEIVDAFLNPTVDKLRNFMVKAYFKPRRLPDLVFEQLVERLQKMPLEPLLKAQMSEKFLDQSPTPANGKVLLLWGESDQIFPSTLGEKLTATHPTWELKKISECGHLPHKECPDKYHAILDETLRQTLR